jgi:hypothetical protein
VFAVIVAWSAFALTGNVFAESGRAARSTAIVAEAGTSYQQMQQPSRLRQDTLRVPATLIKPSEVQEGQRERKRIEERQALSRLPASARHKIESEKREAEMPVPEGRAPMQTGAALDLNGDGTISDFEAGYSAGAAYQRRKGESLVSSRAIEEFKVRRDIRGAVSDRRKFEAEMQLQRRKSPADSLPLTDH